MGQLTWRQVAAVALAGGFPPGAAVIATAITMPEAGRNPAAVQAGQPYSQTGWGLWQITPGNSVPRYGTDRRLLVPLANARAAHWKWQQAGGFSPWTTFMAGKEQPYIGDAEAAVASLRHLSAQQIAALARAARAAGGSGAGQVASLDDWSPQVAAAALHTGRAARHFHGYAMGIKRMQPRLPTPALAPVAPGSVLWTPPRKR
jgi:hypothetical protein